MEINTSVIPVATNSSKDRCKHIALFAGSIKLNTNIFSGFSLIALSKKSSNKGYDTTADSSK